MCGISGWLTSGSHRFGINELQSMVNSLDHRGPDDSGIFHDTARGVGLGHNRLTIIDLSHQGHQPMINESSGDVLVFNGEIYNFLELRRQLEGQGYRFRSTSDTEVLLYSFARWGIGCLEKIQGMFAFALWSAQEETLHLVRDPLGIKPLYYWQLPGDGGIVFASEIKAFLALDGFQAAINRKSLSCFLEFGYCFDSTETIFADVAKLAPGHRLEVRRGRQTQSIRYYRPELQHDSPANAEEIEERLYATLSRVVEEHLIADVPKGLLLSGGFDSSLIASIASRLCPIHTYSFGFANSEVDERPYARLVSKYIGSRHQEILIQPDELLKNLEDTAFYFDDLFGDWGMMTTRLLYQKCREKGIKVVLVGEGADELFGGYEIFRHALPEHDNRPMEWRMFQLYRSYAGRRYGSRYFAFRKKMHQYLHLTDGDLFSAIRLFEARDQLPNNYVMKVDKASMSAGVEARVPFLDARVAAIAWQLPRDMLIDLHNEKKILRSMARRYELLPREILQRRKFGAGIAANWMDDARDFRQYAREVILAQDSWVDELGLRRAMTKYFDQGKSGYSFPRAVSIFRNLAWRLLILNLWARHYPVMGHG